MIYLASPYSAPNAALMEARFREVSLVSAKMMERGLHPYSPIAHLHPIAIAYGLPRDYEFWGKFNRDMIDRADSVMVLMLEGWQESIGVTDEIIYSHKKNKPLTYTESNAWLK